MYPKRSGATGAKTIAVEICLKASCDMLAGVEKWRLIEVLDSEAVELPML